MNGALEGAAERALRHLTTTHAAPLGVKQTEFVIPSGFVPFQPAEILGATGRLFEFEPLPLYEPGPGREPRRGFEVALDSRGRLLRARAEALGTAGADLRPEPSVAAAEKQLQSAGEEYVGLPGSPPAISLTAALQRIREGGIGTPHLAWEISAQYVLHSRRGGPGRAVWAVTLRGIPPIPAKGGGKTEVPVWQRNFIRNVVDAETGEVLFATNVPHP